MRVLMTGSSGWLGSRLVPRLERDGHVVVGLDVVPSEHTTHLGSVADRALIERIMGEANIDSVIHSGALHQPDMARYANDDFVAVNIQGTLNLLEAAKSAGVERFVFTSTTSLMITAAIRAGAAGGARRAAWLTEEGDAPMPRNIYGVTKLAAEHLCRMFAESRGLPVVVLRTGRFFPEGDDMAHVIGLPDANIKANEFLHRRLTVDDAAEAHVAALRRAVEVGFGLYIISAQTPFSPEDCEELITDAPMVVARYFPDFPEIYARQGWTMTRSIDRVYSAAKAERELGFRCATGFAEVLAALARERDMNPP